MPYKDPGTKSPHGPNRITTIDQRDTELTFLKKVNEAYSIRSSSSQSDQGSKRGRTTSDYDNDIHFIGDNTYKRSRSSQRKSRTVINSTLAATTTDQNTNTTPTGVVNMLNQSKNKQSHMTNGIEETYKLDITRGAVAYAVNQSLPLIRFRCEPQVNDQREGTKIVKELFDLIRDDFKKMYPKHHDTIGLESWFIDNKGNICGITRDIQLYTYLCDVNKIPNKLGNYNVTPILPRHLPPQCCVIVKSVPNMLNITDFKIQIESKYNSVYLIEELMGTNNGRSRHIRIDLLYSIDYKQILNSGVIPIDGLCLQVHEYIAGPRIMFCSKCNLPGHSKGKCQHPYERCKRCGSDRNLGEHFECEITCHNCKGDHISTDFSCPVVRNYRQDMIKHIQLHPEILPDDIQIFIPTFCRKNGEKTLSNYHHYSQQNRLQHPVNQNVNDVDQEWPCLPQPSNNTPAYLKSHHNYQSNPDQMKNIQSQMIKLERECEIAKNEYEKKNLRIENKLSSSITQLQSLFVCFSTIIQRQYEMISVLKSAVSECLQVNKVTNQIIRTLVNKNDNYQQCGEVGNQLELIPLDERNEAIEKLFSTYSPLVEDFTKKIMEVTNQFLVTNER